MTYNSKKPFKKLISIALILFIASSSFAQNGTFRKPLFGQIVNLFNQRPLESAHVINLTTTKGTISNYRGEFRLEVALGDTIYFSEMGYHSKKLIVDDKMLQQNNIIKLITQNYRLDEIVVTPYDLTGILEVDVKNLVAVNKNKIIKVGNLKTSSELGPNRHDKPSIFQPVDFIYNIFGKRPKEMRKLKELEETNLVRDLLNQKYDREFLMETMNLSRKQIESILKHCDYNDEYILKANDLQILQAVIRCYDKYEKYIDENGTITK
ncbi:MAG: carboxypeptidase-like regulatory domain-containing protein [Flavobacteriales bacterium]|nr:carboxypeptidase-like regulatory domain-containing protein [Flavobacteriales bacterium]